MSFKNFYSIFTTLLILQPFLAVPQSTAIKWEENYGGSNDERTPRSDLIHTDDGGFLFGGSSNSSDGDLSGNNGDFDYWVLKVDSMGSIEWQRNYGGSNEDRLQAIDRTEDGGSIVVGFSRSSDGDVTNNYGDKDYWVLKLDPSGNIEWEQNYGGNSKDNPRDVQQTQDGGYVVAGLSSSSTGDVSNNFGGDDHWVLKLDPNGNIEWENNFGGPDTERAFAVDQTDDKGYLVGGWAPSARDYWIIRLDSNGVKTWDKAYGGSDNDDLRWLQETSSGDIMAIGSSESSNGDVSGNNGGIDVWVLKLDASGNMKWEQNYGGGGDERGISAQATPDGGFFIASPSDSADGDVSANSGGSDYWAFKIRGDGTMEWEKNFGGAGSEGSPGGAMVSEGEYALVGRSDSAEGDVSGNYGKGDLWLVRIGDTTTTSLMNASGKGDLDLYPNPTKGTFRIDLEGVQEPIEVSVRDLTGREVSKRLVEKGTSSIKMDIDGKKDGLYLVEIRSEDGIKEILKVVKK